MVPVPQHKPAPRQKVPFLGWIITLCIVDTVLLVANAYVYLTFWERIFQ